MDPYSYQKSSAKQGQKCIHYTGFRFKCLYWGSTTKYLCVLNEVMTCIPLFLYSAKRQPITHDIGRVINSA